jgi:DNA-binding transcriptional LysR family regulator
VRHIPDAPPAQAFASSSKRSTAPSRIIGPTFILYRAIERGALVPLLTDCRWPALNAYAVYPRTRHLSRRVRAFVDFLAERFSGVPYWDRSLTEPDSSAG